MKGALVLVLLVFANYLACKEIKTEDWLLWHKVETDLPFSSTLSIYPPVTLYSENGILRGSIATPYELGENNRLINEFLITVTDGVGRIHFLKPKIESVGFVNNHGISMSSLKSNSFQAGSVLVQFYKINSYENRQELRERESANLKKKLAVNDLLASIELSKPVIGDSWEIQALTLSGKKFENIVSSSNYTIVQLYSPFCGFCRNTIPLTNALNKSDGISVVGLAGVESIEDFKEHLNANNVQYPFVTYEGEYAESAILKAVEQQGFPTYFVLDSLRKVRGIFVGHPALVSWLETQL